MKKFILTALIISLVCIIQAQDDDFYGQNAEKISSKELKKTNRQNKLEKWSFGSNLLLSIGQDAYIEATPFVLYKISPNLMVGPGYSFTYFKYLQPFYENHIHGPRIIINYTLISDLQEKININIGNIVLQGEYEYLNTLEINSNKLIIDSRVWVSGLLLGGGIFEPIGSRSGMSIIVLYNFLEDRNSLSIQGNPVFRVSFHF